MNVEIRYSIFCGSLFNPGHRGGQSNHQVNVSFWRSFI